MIAAKIILGISIFWTLLSLVIVCFNHDEEVDTGLAIWCMIMLFSISVLIGSAIYLGAS